jgi:CBS domain-containing protein
MKAKDLINYMIPPLKVSDDLEKARQWMEELRVSELPVTDKGRFLGMFEEEMLFNEANLGKTIGSLELKFTDALIEESTHYYNVLKRAYSLGTRLVAVIDDESQYLGVISVEDVVEAFASSSLVHTTGAILVLSMEYRDYSLSEISRIIEMNEGKVMSSHMMADPNDPTQIKLTLKINKEEILHLVSSLESQGYRVIESHSSQDKLDHDHDRYDAFMKFLKI